MSEQHRLPVIQPPQASGAPPIFDRIAIVGLGLIGGSIALAARRLWPKGLVIGVDDKDVLEQAMVRHAIDVAADDAVVMAEADLVVLAAPVRQNLELVDAVAENVRTPAVVTDVGSTKRAMVEAAKRLPPRFQFVGGHPLGGAARGGIEFARADLFEGRPWIFTPAGEGAGDALDRLMAFAAALGAIPRTMAPDRHDALLAAVSHVPQLAASALMSVVGQHGGDEGLALSGRGLYDTTRLASSPASTWIDICHTNADHIGGVLDDLIENLRRLRSGLESDRAIAELFDEANRWRARVPRKPE